MVKPSDFLKIKIASAGKAPTTDGLFRVYCNRWWSTDGEHIFFYKYYSSPQCNAHEAIARRLQMINHFNDVIYIETVYVPHICEV